jgi:hypothetical protein
MTDIVAPTPIANPPPAPLITDTPADFDTKSFTLAGWYQTLVTALNGLIANVFGNATAAHERATAAASSASVASAAASAAVATTQADLFSAATAYAAGDAAIDPVNLQAYRRLVAGSSATHPRLDPLVWLRVGPRETLTAPRTYYVRTDGNDTNGGQANTAGGAFATLQKAVDTVCSLDNAGHVVTIQLGAGTHAPVVLRPYVGSAVPEIVGNAGTPSSVVISGTANNASTGTAVYANNAGVWSLSGVKVASSYASGIYASGRTTLMLSGGMEFGACASRHLIAASQAQIASTGGAWRISGNAARHVVASTGAIVSYDGATVTLDAGIAFGTEFAECNMAFLQFFSTTFSGSATGKRFSVYRNGAIVAFGAGASFLPGNVAGTTASGGLYD